MTTFRYPQPPRRFQCPHCGHGNFSAHGLHQHCFDTGAATVRPAWACEVLFAKRNAPRPDALPAHIDTIVWRCAS